MYFRIPHLCSKIPKINNRSMDSGVYTGEPKPQPLVYIELQPPDYAVLMP